MIIRHRKTRFVFAFKVWNCRPTLSQRWNMSELGPTNRRLASSNFKTVWKSIWTIQLFDPLDTRKWSTTHCACLTKSSVVKSIATYRTLFPTNTSRVVTCVCLATLVAPSRWIMNVTAYRTIRRSTVNTNTSSTIKSITASTVSIVASGRLSFRKWAVPKTKAGWVWSIMPGPAICLNANSAASFIVAVSIGLATKTQPKHASVPKYIMFGRARSASVRVHRMRRNEWSTA